MNKKEVQPAIQPADDNDHIVLRLFITGATPNSIRAITNIKQICEDHFKGRYSLEVIDVYKEEIIAEREQLIALPLLIKQKPLPERRLIGDLSDTKKVLNALGIL
jgi:circadian clock protein KaiB